MAGEAEQALVRQARPIPVPRHEPFVQVSREAVLQVGLEASGETPADPRAFRVPGIPDLLVVPRSRSAATRVLLRAGRTQRA